MYFHGLMFFCLMFFPFCLVQSQNTYNSDKASQEAKTNNKTILLIFSGSDWCRSCMHFDKEILQNPDFISFADQQLVLLKCDFPQRKILPPDIIKQNEALAEKYNPDGDFPAILLLNDDMTLITTLRYSNQSSTQFITEVKNHLSPAIILKEYRKKVSLMGSFFEFVIVADKEERAMNHIQSCIDEATRIENLISEWIPDSEVSKINDAAGKEPLWISKEVYDLLERALAIGKLTQGAFDISFLPLYNYWKFDRNPVVDFDTLAIKKLTAFVDYTKIQLLPDSKVSIPRGYKIGLGGIGQGYAVDKIKALLLKKKVKNFIINSSGDVYAHGNRADGSPWKVGIASPVNTEKIVKWLNAKDRSVVTSGTSEKNFVFKDKVYGHIINPITGFPVRGLQSVTVICKSAEMSDALATALLILGPDIGIDLIDQLPDINCLFMDSKGNIRISNGLSANIK
jgi:FAD:protein FMN transferase